MPYSTHSGPTRVTGHTDIGVWTPPAGQIRHQAPHAAPPIVILPGFGNNSNDYIAPFGNSQEGIVQALQVHGLLNSTARAIAVFT